MEKEKYQIESLLPKDYIYKLGLYLQTCAHIEHWVCRSICLIEQSTKGSHEFDDRFNELRLLPTSELITALNNSAKKYSKNKDWSKYLSEISGWMHRHVDNRHLATHGAHFASENCITIKSAAKGKRPSDTRLLFQEVEAIVEDADRILKNLVHFCVSSFADTEFMLSHNTPLHRTD